LQQEWVVFVVYFYGFQLGRATYDYNTITLLAGQGFQLNKYQILLFVMHFSTYKPKTTVYSFVMIQDGSGSMVRGGLYIRTLLRFQ